MQSGPNDKLKWPAYGLNKRIVTTGDGFLLSLQRIAFSSLTTLHSILISEFHSEVPLTLIKNLERVRECICEKFANLLGERVSSVMTTMLIVINSLRY